MDFVFSLVELQGQLELAHQIIHPYFEHQVRRNLLQSVVNLDHLDVLAFLCALHHFLDDFGCCVVDVDDLVEHALPSEDVRDCEVYRAHL